MTIFENHTVNESIDEDLYNARNSVNTNPTDKQKMAGNYKKGHVTINGYKISIENPKGSIRRGKDKNGHEWTVTMAHDYGYFIKKTKGKDGEPIDVFIGDDLESKKIYVVDQKVRGKFDESKVMFCFDSEEKARQGYNDCYEEGWKGLWKITPVSQETFRKWLYDGYRQRKPFYQYVEIIKSNKKEKKENNMKKKMHINEEQLLSLIRENVKQTLMEAENENFFDRLRGKASAFFKGNSAEDDGYTVDKEMKDEYVNQYETDKERTRLLSNAIKNIENAIAGTEKAKETGYLNGRATGEATENFLPAAKRMAYILKNVIARGRSTMSAYSNAAFKPQPNYDTQEHDEETMDNNSDSRPYTYRRKSPYSKTLADVRDRRSGLGQMRYVSESIDDIVKESINNVIRESREVQGDNSPRK